jgi:hypothetical protein
MSWFELFRATARQLANRQLAEAQRRALEHAAEHEHLLVKAEMHAALCKMYRERSTRISKMLGYDTQDFGDSK